MKFWLALGTLSCLCLCHSLAADWPQWRGLNRNSISEEHILSAFPAEGPKVLWRASVGTGFSSMSVSVRRVYTIGNANNQETIWCLDAETGQKIWQHTYPAALGPVYYEGGPGSTPTVDRGRVITIGKWGDVFCLDAAKGTIAWQKNLREEGLKTNRWGFAGSPLIYQDSVILNAGSAGTALDRKTGRVLWSNGTNATGYASPTIFKRNGQDIVLIFAAKHLVALEPKTGKELWRSPFETGYDTNNGDPLIYENKLFISSYSHGSVLLDADQTPPTVVYDTQAMHSHLSPGVLLGEYLYAFNGEAKDQTDFRCLDLPKGTVTWTRKDPAFGTLICADGKLVILTEKGELILAQPSPEELKILARAQVLGGLCWTPPALARGLLYARNAKGDLICVDLRPNH